MALNPKPYSAAGKAYLEALTQWLQDTRLLSEAVSRLHSGFKKNGRVTFSESSWPKPEKGNLPLKTFAIGISSLTKRMDSLLRTVWSERFVFLETLWEEYLEELAKELRHRDSQLFEPFVERDFMADIIREVISGRLGTVEEIKDEVAARFASGLTRQPWEQQWKQLRKLDIGLTDADRALPWFSKLEAYFEMRNCIIHRQGRVSAALRKKDSFFARPEISTVDVWPPQLDFYRHQFIACLMHMESKLAGKFAAETTPDDLAPTKKGP
jgi:hypothetical protein